MTVACVLSVVRRVTVFGALLPAALSAQRATSLTPERFTLEQVLSYPYPSELVTAPTGARVAWVFDERGQRNVWTAAAPDWEARPLTAFTGDDGQELTNLTFTPDGSAIVFVRGGDHDANWPAEGGLQPDPSSSPVQPQMDVWMVPVSGGAARKIGDGDEPHVSPAGDRVVFTRNHQLWVAPMDGAKEPRRLFFDRGEDGEVTWSPDGSKLAFVSDRGDHSFIGVFTNDSTPIVWIAPSTSRDFMPRWSPDGAHLAFVRIPGRGGAPQTLLDRHPFPWSIWTADAASCATEPTQCGRWLWRSPVTLVGSLPQTDGGPNLAWAAGNRIVFLSDVDGWPHLYSIPATGGEPTLLTPGRFMAEFIRLSPDRKFLVYAANTGKDANDDDRRHIFQVPVDRAIPVALTPGAGVEWTPAVTGDSRSVAYLGASATRPPLPMVVPVEGGTPVMIGADRIPAEFPTAQLVVPRKVTFRAPDGTTIHGQLFEAAGQTGKRPGVIFVHGGPPRQMLLGWHYMDYYSNAYAVNQYLASRGFAVMTVNYRLGIGYGHAFHHPAHWGPWGESEYQDVKAAGEYLRGLPEVDAKRVGIWGGSYGGLLTALALARNSDLFATGVDLHGVHDWTLDLGIWLDDDSKHPAEKSDRDRALQVAWQSSPVSQVSTWRSPVLLIQGDDDRNVRFHQTVDLARRLDAHHVRYQELVLPDEIHGFLRWHSWLTADRATTAWLEKELGGGESVSAR